MTLREGAIVTAYTGIVSCSSFQVFHEYVEEKMGRPVYTHELASNELLAILKTKK